MLHLLPVLLLSTLAAFLAIRVEAPIVVLIVVLHLALATTVYFIPFGLGNPYVTHLVTLFTQPTPANRRRFIVQATFHPRLRTGLRAFAEDADDIGVLRFDDADFVFEGDSTTIRLPLDKIGGIGLKNIGWRGLWLAGERVAVNIRDLQGVDSLEIVERSSWTIRKSRRVTQELYQLLEFHLQRHRPS